MSQGSTGENWVHFWQCNTGKTVFNSDISNISSSLE